MNVSLLKFESTRVFNNMKLFISSNQSVATLFKKKERKIK